MSLVPIFLVEFHHFLCIMSNSGGGYSVPNIIRRKRDGQELEDGEIRYIIDSIIAPAGEERIHDAQIGKK